ncbi:hypothetical protein SESBI_14527 [Sesbania bispinosa]|nr:hypothetical protein SESBI_14527 [Sesbania bispinosa]
MEFVLKNMARYMEVLWVHGKEMGCRVVFVIHELLRGREGERDAHRGERLAWRRMR